MVENIKSYKNLSFFCNTNNQVIHCNCLVDVKKKSYGSVLRDKSVSRVFQLQTVRWNIKVATVHCTK